MLFVLVGLYIGINISGLHHQASPEIVFEHASFGETNIRNGVHKNSGEDYTKIREQLEKSQSETLRWQAEAQKLQDNNKSSLKKIRELEGSCNIKDETKKGGSAKENRHPLCQSVMPHPAPSAMALWNEHVREILKVTRMPHDFKYAFHDFTTQLLQIISPRLPRSVKTTPFDWRPVENALTVGWERYQYLKLPKEEQEAIPIHDRPRPLKVLIMGGSLLVGTNCARLKQELGFEFGMPRRECNWSRRFFHFINGFFLGEDHAKMKKVRLNQLVEVAKVAMGGTNSATGSVIWEYDLIPEETQNPDILINAYSTNDMHILTIQQAKASNSTLRDKTFEMIQDFVRRILGTKRCPTTKGIISGNEPIPPLLLHMDDYLGNEQLKIWETTELAQGAQVLANYYGFVAMSYADVVREFVYGDTYEKWFSAEWWVHAGKSLAFERQIHPGMGMHISAVWVTAYNLLHLASSYCSLPTDALIHESNNEINEYEVGLWGLPELQSIHKQAMGKPKPQPKGLPPELTNELRLEDVTSLWREQSSTSKNGGSSHHTSSSCKSDQNNGSGVHTTHLAKCPFSWVSGLSLQQNNISWVDEYFQQQSISWVQWEISDDEKKIGFIPSPGAEKAVMILNFMYPHQQLNSVTLFYMKSYGTKWENSKLRLDIFSVPSSGQELGRHLGGRDLLGSHSKNTSEMYTEEIILAETVQASKKIQVEATLSGGGTFKIMGLAVCS